MRVGTILVILLLTATLAGCSGSSSDSSSTTTGKGSSTSSSPSASVPHSTTTSQPASSSTSPATTSSGTSSSNSSSPPANGTAGAPAPVSVECTLAGGGQTFAGPSVTLTCKTPDITSSTGGAFTKGHAKVTFSGAPPSNPATANTFSVADANGTAMGSAQGASPIEYDLTSIPTLVTFTLTATLKTTGPTVAGTDTVTGKVHIDLS